MTETASAATTDRRPGAAAAVSTSLVLTLALQSAVPPFATDMYTPAFPEVTTGLATSASLVGLTLTTIFLGMALGQLLGGPLSDQRVRVEPRHPRWPSPPLSPAQAAVPQRSR